MGRGDEPGEDFVGALDSDPRRRWTFLVFAAGLDACTRPGIDGEVRTKGPN
jgi:hypothetical protein